MQETNAWDPTGTLFQRWDVQLSWHKYIYIWLIHEHMCAEVHARRVAHVVQNVIPTMATGKASALLLVKNLW